MKNIILFFTCSLFGLFNFCLSAGALDAVDILSETAILMDAVTGQILFDKDGDKQVYPASTTKIMTAVLAVENAYPAEMMTTSESAVKLGEPNSSTIALTEGEELAMEDALYALMLPSANDAANVIAEHVAGDQASFARMMTEKAHMIGALNTNFTNAHGLHNPEHYTTARDMAIMTQYAAGDSRFMQYFGADYYTIPATNKQGSERPLTNYQYMLLKTSRFYYEGVIGGKVGFTNPAKNTMSTIAKRNGRTLIAVVMGSSYHDDKFRDTKRLLDYGFDEFVPLTIKSDNIEPFEVPIVEGGIEVGSASLRGGADVTFLIHDSADPSQVTVKIECPKAFERNGKITGEARYYAESEAGAPELLGAVPLKIQTQIYDIVTASLNLDGRQKVGGGFGIGAGWILFSLLICFLSYLLIFRLFRWYNIRKKRRERMRRLQYRMRANETAGRTR